jgi:hypothetical protein
MPNYSIEMAPIDAKSPAANSAQRMAAHSRSKSAYTGDDAIMNRMGATQELQVRTLSHASAPQSARRRVERLTVCPLEERRLAVHPRHVGDAPVLVGGRRK